MKQIMIHNAANIRHGTTRKVMSTVAVHKWKLWLKDSFQAFGQTGVMTRYVALEPAPEFDLDPDVLLEVLKYLYGLSES